MLHTTLSKAEMLLEARYIIYENHTIDTYCLSDAHSGMSTTEVFICHCTSFSIFFAIGEGLERSVGMDPARIECH